MYYMQYAEVVENGCLSARERESFLFDRCIEKLTYLEVEEPSFTTLIETAGFIENFWLTLIEDLGREDNALAADLKASIISIGIYVMKEMMKLRNNEKVDIATLIAISKALRDGLAAN